MTVHTIVTLRTKNGETLDVTLVNKDTKKAQGMLDRYKKSTCDDIMKAYKKPSHEKVRTFEVIKNEFKRVNGKSLRITGAGCDVYSCAYVVVSADKVYYLIYHTPCNRFAIKL